MFQIATYVQSTPMGIGSHSDVNAISQDAASLFGSLFFYLDTAEAAQEEGIDGSDLLSRNATNGQLWRRRSRAQMASSAA